MNRICEGEFVKDISPGVVSRMQTIAINPGNAKPTEASATA